MIKNLKDWFTDLIGAVIMIATLVAVWHGDIQWQWEGLIGMAVGFVFLWVPDDVILKYIKKKVDKNEPTL